MFENEKMKLTVKTLIFITMIIFLLSGCEVGKHKKPYSAKQLTGLLEKQYESKDRFTFMKSIERDEYERESYLFHDKKNDIDFIVKSWVERNMVPFIPIISKEQYWKEYLNTSIIFSCREQATALAEIYGLKLFTVPDLSDEPIMGRVFISKYDQMLNATAFFLDLTALYNLDISDSPIELGVYYHPCPDTLTNTKDDGVINLAWLSPGRPGSERYERYRNLAGGLVNSGDYERYLIFKAMENGWEEAYRKGNLYIPFGVDSRNAEDCIQRLQLSVKSSGQHNFSLHESCCPPSKDDLFESWFKSPNSIQIDNDFPVDRLSDDRFLHNYWISKTRLDSELEFTIERQNRQDYEIVLIQTKKWSPVLVLAYKQGMKGCVVLQTEKTRIQNDIKELERMMK